MLLARANGCKSVGGAGRSLTRKRIKLPRYQQALIVLSRCQSQRARRSVALAPCTNPLLSRPSKLPVNAQST